MRKHQEKLYTERWTEACIPGDSENREHSQNSRIQQARVDIGNVNVTFSIPGDQCSAGVSDFLEHSQNSLLNGEPKVDTGDVSVSFSVHGGQCLTAASEFREVSSNSWLESECSQGTHHKQSMKSVCTSDPSETSRNSLTPRSLKIEILCVLSLYAKY